MRIFCGLLVAAACVAAGPVCAQEFESRGERDEIETDRDSFTPAISTVARRQYVAEAAYTFIDNQTGPEAHSLPELLVRRGVNDWCELRLGWNYEMGGSGTASGNEFGGEDLQAETEGRMLYGAKVRTSRQSGLLPAGALIVQGYTPTAGPSNFTSVSVGQAWGWTFANGWVWNSAIRYGTGNETGDAFNQWAPSTVLKIPLGERWNVHAEYFGILSQGKDAAINEHFASFGGHVLLTPNLELGTRFGFGLNEQTPGFFNNVGLGWRF